MIGYSLNSLMNEVYYTPSSNEISPFLNSIGLYIIKKIHEEDFQSKKEVSMTEKSKIDSLCSTIDNIYCNRIQSKVAITELILKNKDIIYNLKEFYDEDCQLSLMNWVNAVHKDLKQSFKNEKINKNKLILNKNQEILLFNIINILEILPIKPDDLISLNFIDILKKIKKDIKTQNDILYNKIKKLLNFWKSIIVLYNEQKTNFEVLNKKRLRNENAIFNEKKDEDSSMSLFDSETLGQSQKNIKLKKKVSWKEENSLKEVIGFDPNEAPSEI